MDNTRTRMPTDGLNLVFALLKGQIDQKYLFLNLFF